MEKENSRITFKDALFKTSQTLMLLTFSASTAVSMFVLNRTLDIGANSLEAQAVIEEISQKIYGPKERGIARCSANGGVAIDMRFNYTGYLNEAAACTGMSKMQFQVFLQGYPAP